MSKFQIFRSSVNNYYYFRFMASNGEQILSSEAYATKQGCVNGVASVKANAPYDSTYIRVDNPSNYRFNMKANNNEIIARSSEGYTTSYNREHAITLVKRDAPSANVVDLT
ncbi:YegP family protein [Arcicella aquatica]|uniref:YegP family protein n=1 Tax=Arcicella aquatica TaxID=217141 RepID=A0ABU5QSV9_9BACT|nr:YegP family protein [Arcicella aquatica]MEA5259476.1 YegP family protein [Arcicella aquatica]